MGAFAKLAVAIAAPLLLLGCVLEPGKFESHLTVNADRSFTFTYVGEVYGDEDKMKEEGKTDAQRQAEQDVKNRALAETLAKEAGYRSVRYMGGNRFLIDYEIRSRLTHNFIYPFNIDGEVLIPFIAIELRANGTARVQAPGFANADEKKAGGLPTDEASKLDGTFTLDTDAAIVSQNNEEGAKAEAGRQVISWRVTPATKAAPMAVLRFGS